MKNSSSFGLFWANLGKIYGQIASCWAHFGVLLNSGFSLAVALDSLIFILAQSLYYMSISNPEVRCICVL